jgi:hypothetical protein
MPVAIDVRAPAERRREEGARAGRDALLSPESDTGSSGTTGLRGWLDAPPTRGT